MGNEIGLNAGNGNGIRRIPIEARDYKDRNFLFDAADSVFQKKTFGFTEFFSRFPRNKNTDVFIPLDKDNLFLPHNLSTHQPAIEKLTKHAQQCYDSGEKDCSIPEKELDKRNPVTALPPKYYYILGRNEFDFSNGKIHFDDNGKVIFDLDLGMEPDDMDWNPTKQTDKKGRSLANELLTLFGGAINKPGNEYTVHFENPHHVQLEGNVDKHGKVKFENVVIPEDYPHKELYPQEGTISDIAVGDIPDIEKPGDSLTAYNRWVVY